VPEKLIILELSSACNFSLPLKAPSTLTGFGAPPLLGRCNGYWLLHLLRLDDHQLVPPGCPAIRPKLSTSLPALLESHHGESNLVLAVKEVELINGLHQPLGSSIFRGGILKQAQLKYPLLSNASEQHPCLFELDSLSPNLLDQEHRILQQRGGVVAG